MTTSGSLAPLSAHTAVLRVGALMIVLLSLLRLRSSRIPSR